MPIVQPWRPRTTFAIMNLEPVRLGERTWTELADDRPRTLLVPVGSLEQHGPHLPLDTDTRIAAAVARRAAAGDPALLLAPPLAYGASGEHEGFPGTLSIGHDALRAVLVELGRSAARWANRLVFVNGHGGNLPTVPAAVTRLRAEGREVAWVGCTVPEGDAHAGRTGAGNHRRRRLPQQDGREYFRRRHLAHRDRGGLEA